MVLFLFNAHWPFRTFYSSYFIYAFLLAQELTQHPTFKLTYFLFVNIIFSQNVAVFWCFSIVFILDNSPLNSGYACSVNLLYNKYKKVVQYFIKSCTIKLKKLYNYFFINKDVVIFKPLPK